MSKLIKSLQIETPLHFIQVMEQLNMSCLWGIILYKIIIDHIPYEKAGEPFGMSKQAIYSCLTNVQKRMIKNAKKENANSN